MGIRWNFTFAVNKEQTDGAQLTIVPYEDWKAICENNKKLPTERRRYFIRLYDVGDNGMNCTFIEAPYAYYLEWHREHEAQKQQRRYKRLYSFVSLDAPMFEDSGAEYGQLLDAPDISVERLALSDIAMWELADEMDAWEEWATDVLDAYMSGDKRKCTKVLAAKYGVSEQTIRSYKRLFEAHVTEILLGNSELH